MTGTIFDIKEFGVHDGPGLVTTVFLKGCPLKCLWCHNPEGQSFEKELMISQKKCHHCGLCLKRCEHDDCQPFGRCLHICPENCISIAGIDLQSKELAEKILKNSDVIEGVTFSGGEPLAQPEFLLETIQYLKNFKINIETSGFCDSDTFRKVISKANLIYFDIKLADEDKHIQYTGQSNKLILKNFQILRESGKDYIVRTPLIPTVTDTDDNLQKIRAIIGDSRHELLPYNEMAAVKYKMLDREYLLEEL